MSALQNIDFNNPSKEVLFELCMGEIKYTTGHESLSQYGLGHLKKQEEIIEIEKKLHKNLLRDYHLTPFSKLLRKYQQRWFLQRDSRIRDKEKYHDELIEKLKYKLEVSKIVKMLLLWNSSTNQDFKIAFSYPMDKIDINNNEILVQIKEIYIKEFESLELNETFLTREEALAEIENLEDNDFFIEYGEPEFYDGLYINIDLVPEDLIEFYMDSHTKPREVTLEIVNDVIKEHEKWLENKNKKDGVGAKIKTMDIGELARRLSYLHRIHIFLNTEKYKSIKNVPLTNKTCRFVFDYFELWNSLLDENTIIDDDIIKDRQDKEADKEKRANYIKYLIRNNRDFAERGKVSLGTGHKIIDTSLEVRIDLFKQAYIGAISPDEYNKRISSISN